MSELSFGLIGVGSIGRSIIDGLHRGGKFRSRLAAVLVKPHQVESARQLVDREVEIFWDTETFLDRAPELIVEAAGHSAVLELAGPIIGRGKTLMTLSVGALVDDDFRMSLVREAASTGGRLFIPVGALAGLDGLLALRQAGLLSVEYTSTKPPVSWKGTVAEEWFELDSLMARTTIYDGSAGDAARLFPQNANLAAAVALAGLGFSKTRVKLIADPEVTGNAGCVEAKGIGSSLAINVEGRQNPQNPKTSMIVGASVLSAIENRCAAISFI